MMLAAAVLACLGTIAHGETLFQDVPETVPKSVTQQRALLQATPPAVVYANEKATAVIYLLINPPNGTTLDSRKYGLAHFNARVKPTLRKFNRAYPNAHLNLRATYVSGPTTIVGPRQGWLTYAFTVDLGPPGNVFRSALRSELRSVLRKRSKWVKVTRGNIP